MQGRRRAEHEEHEEDDGPADESAETGHASLELRRRGALRERLRDLTERATMAENCYTHRWRAGDFLLWDNGAVMHRARPFDMTRYGRDMRSVRLVDTADVA